MGRNNKKYHKTLHQQSYELLVSKHAFGESKRAAKAAGTAQDKIYSFNTYKTYWQQVKQFIKWVVEKYPECTTLRRARKYVSVWLKERTDAGLSAWTIHTGAKALGKLYGITPDSPDYFVPPQRKRADIKRSRGEKAKFPEEKNLELVNFCKGTGLRRRELTALRGSDLFSKEEIEALIITLSEMKKLTAEEEKLLIALKDTEIFDGYNYFIHVRSGKGGKKRVCPIIGETVSDIVERMHSTGADEKVWKHVSSHADVHAYRAVYATNLYIEHARPIKEIPFDKINKGTGRWYQGEVYCCRRDKAGTKLDKKAMLLSSKALGHNRISVIANNYIRDL